MMQNVLRKILLLFLFVVGLQGALIGNSVDADVSAQEKTLNPDTLQNFLPKQAKDISLDDLIDAELRKEFNARKERKQSQTEQSQTEHSPLKHASAVEKQQVSIAAEHVRPEKKKKIGLLEKVYLSKGELLAPLICKAIFPIMTPEQINESIRDIIRFIEKYVKVATENKLEKIGETFLANILHTYGHIITFIKDARVNLKTKKVFTVEKQEWVSNAIRLTDYWTLLQKEKGIKLYHYKFYATCIDFLAIMLRSYLLFPCRDREQKKEVEDRWLWWMGKVTRTLNGHPIFGGYYHENLENFHQVFLIWKDDYDKEQELKRETNKKLYGGTNYETSNYDEYEVSDEYNDAASGTSY